MSDNESRNEERTNLIEQGVRFLQHPNVQNTPISERISFLEKKGLTLKEIAQVRKLAEEKKNRKSSSDLPSKADIASSTVALASAVTAIAGERLKDRVVIVLGGNTGLGQIIAVRCAKEGAKVVIFDKKIDGVCAPEETIKKLNGEVLFISGDFTKWESVDSAVSEAVQVFGRIDVMINHATTLPSSHSKSIAQSSPEDWDNSMGCCSRSVFLGCKRAIQQMLTQEPTNGIRGRIINISSIFGMVASQNKFLFGVNKSVIVQLTRQIALEYGNEGGIICNSVAAGHIVDSNDPNDAVTLSTDLRNKKAYPNNGKAIDVSNTVVFLASDESSYIQGINMVVDGGALAT